MNFSMAAMRLLPEPLASTTAVAVRATASRPSFLLHSAISLNPTECVLVVGNRTPHFAWICPRFEFAVNQKMGVVDDLGLLLVVMELITKQLAHFYERPLRGHRRRETSTKLNVRK